MDFSWVNKPGTEIEPFEWGEYAIITNGSILFRVPRKNFPGDLKASPSYLTDKIENLFPSLKETMELTPFPSLKTLGIEPDSWLKKCPNCEGTGMLAQCPECEGCGVITWETAYNDYEATCQTCWGDKFLPGDSRAEEVPCEECDGTGQTVEVIPCQIYQISISNFYAYHLAQLDGCKIQTNIRDGQPVYFVFDGGDGVVMPIT